MGYLTKVEGEIVVDPPLNHKEVTHLFENDTFKVAHNYEVRRSLRPIVETVTNETDNGTLTTRWVNVFEPPLDQFKAGSLEAEVQSLVLMFPNHIFEGYLEGWGEDNGDIWRIYVDEDRAVHKVKPELVWPSLGIENWGVLGV